MKRFIAFVLVMIPVFANCEIYRDINNLDSLGEIRAKFPSAIVKKLSPAWAQPADSLYQLTGNGLSGTIIVKFVDQRPSYIELAKTEVDIAKKEHYKAIGYDIDNDSLFVSWVRWIPDEVFPIQRLISKYGSPEESGFSDENYQPYRYWEKRGVKAFLSDDEKFVSRIDFNYTKDEQRKAYFKKYKFIPDHLKEDLVPPKKK